MGELIRQTMVAAALLALLALSSTCHGAALDRVRRAEIVGELDRAFDLFGVHLGLKYHDPQNRAKGGELRVAVDDVKMFFPRARTKTFDVNFKFDGGDRKTDGLFKLDIDYHLVHADDFGVEAGTLRMFREKRGNQWVSHLKTETSGTPYGVRSIVPGALNNLQLDLVSDRQTMLKLNYVNKWRNMDLELQLDRVPGQQVRTRLTHRTWLVMDLTFRAADLDLDLRRLDGEFMVGVDGLVLSEAVSGSVEMSKVPAGRRLKVDISKGDRKALEVDAKIIGNLKEFTSKAAYSVMGGAKQGKLDLSFDHNPLSVSVSDKVSGDKWGLKVFLNPRQKVGIEGLKNKESVWSFLSKIETTPTKLNMKTDININPQAMLYTLMEVYLPFRAFTQRQSLLSFSLDATPHNYLMSKMDLDFDLRGEDDAVLMKVKLEAAAPRYYSLFYVLNVMDVETTITRNIGENCHRHRDEMGASRLSGDRPQLGAVQIHRQELPHAHPLQQEVRRVRDLRQQGGEEHPVQQVLREGRGEEGRPDRDEGPADD